MADSKSRAPAANEWVPASMANPGENLSDESATQTNGNHPPASNGATVTVETHPVTVPNGAVHDVAAPTNGSHPPSASNGAAATVEVHPVAPPAPVTVAVPNGAAATVEVKPPVSIPSPIATPTPASRATIEVSPAANVQPAAEVKPAEPAPKKRRLPIPLIVLVVIVGAYFVWQYTQTNGSDTARLSGTIEADEIHLASQIGGRARKIYANEGDRVTLNENLIDIYSMSGVNESITSPINGVVLERLIEPGEIALPNSTLIVVADLDALSLTVYVPEDEYGRVQLGQTYGVTVDSFPGQVFSGRVSHIADQAEYTPRNVQTVEGRKSTVFAVKLDLDPTGGKLKPGMPADVDFEAK